MKDIVAIVIWSKPEHIRLARAVLSAYLRLKEIKEQDILDLELGLNEALANVIKHTYKFDSSKQIKISFGWSEEKRELLIAIRDYGCAVNPTIFCHVSPPNPYKEGGFGLYIIKKIFDEVELVNLERGNLLKLRKVFL
ncbi:ATP-binding protein [Pseudothermotoga thermarum]|uniref:Putative anti-sigma regulatory factor, serine/threonine protein kinase n=1 Tax=Pseudothermotoga thermarum DSM 5069 TaxID=688269 RepID=F7YYU6_9THEM|nr:ATP-binding protein [Pseudothermotoga thermarum]AEH51136.1 putative anti-sigma regulatory factor, serine/threonine protein kinase [Pseudothermotoga thermarum DSM 5069]